MLGQAPATLVLAALAAVLALVAAAELAVALPRLAAALRRGAARPPPPYPLRFLAVGDWGRGGADNQSLVADAMAGWARARGGIDFIVSTGGEPAGSAAPERNQPTDQLRQLTRSPATPL
jgi:tartrate-resistant acid phosphatase type 5